MNEEEIVEFEGPDNIAAILLEGVTGSNGLIIPPTTIGRASAGSVTGIASC